MPVSYAQMACMWMNSETKASIGNPSTRTKEIDSALSKQANEEQNGDWMPSRESQKHLVTGFVGRRTPHIPRDLISLMILFYDETTYWTLTKGDLREFKSRRNGQVMYGPSFKLDDIDFMTTLCPFGWKPQQSGSVQFYIELRSLPKSISSVTVYYELWCAQTQSHCKKLRTFRRASDAQSWGTNNMRFAECADFDKLEFASLVKLLRVSHFNKGKKEQKKEKEQKEQEKYFGDIDAQALPSIEIRMPALTEYSWRISGAQIKKMAACEEGKFWYSPSFGRNCFCFELAPNGWHHSNRGTLMLYSRLLALPHRVGLIECECRFGGIAEMLPPQTQTHSFCYERHGLQWGAAEVARSEKLSELKELDIEIAIQITRVCALDGTEVPREMWTEFGIM